MLLTIINCTGSSYKEVPTGGSAAWTITPNSGYKTEGATFSPSGCGTISGSTVTISNVHNAHTCTVTLQSSDPLKYFTYTGDYAIKKASDYNLDTSNGDYTVLALLDDGTLTFGSAFSVDIFAVGGGGNGGIYNSTFFPRGGGGGGGYTNTWKNLTVTSANIPVTIGGAGETTSISIGGTTYSSAGGSSGSNGGSSSGGRGGDGGSGGGGGTNANSGDVAGGGGYDGKNGSAAYIVTGYPGGSGGTGQGTTTRAFGESSATMFAGGGAGGNNGAGGAGGGGNGNSKGEDNTGGGGGGSSSSTRYAGGSGIILIRVHK